METLNHDICSLFEQLGLDNNDAAIDAFINKHKPLAPRVLIHQADFWSRSQAGFLQQAIEEDADWAYAVDQLDTMLR